jgi:hypothetical protein
MGERCSVSEYNYQSFPLDLDAETFAAFPLGPKAGTAAPDGQLTDGATGAVVRLSDLWKSETLVIEFGSFT